LGKRYGPPKGFDSTCPHTGKKKETIGIKKKRTTAALRDLRGKKKILARQISVKLIRGQEGGVLSLPGGGGIRFKRETHQKKNKIQSSPHLLKKNLLAQKKPF